MERDATVEQDPTLAKKRSPFTTRLQETLYASLLEFIGTFFFLLFGLGGIQSAASLDSAGTLEKVLYISTSMGLSLLFSAWLFYRVTGALFNPNVSLALLIVGIIGPVQFVLYCTAQMAGAIAASAMLLALTPGDLASNNFVQPGVNLAQAVFIEMFITAALVLAVLMMAAEKHHATPFAPIGIGLTLFACHLFAVNYTGAAMNTARAFGPAVVTGFPSGKHWVYWLGPFLGTLVASLFYSILKHYRYWTINPDQATNQTEKSPDDPIQVNKARVSNLRRSGGVKNDDNV